MALTSCYDAKKLALKKIDLEKTVRSHHITGFGTTVMGSAGYEPALPAVPLCSFVQTDQNIGQYLFYQERPEKEQANHHHDLQPRL
jgi:hypothetical protein